MYICLKNTSTVFYAVIKLDGPKACFGNEQQKNGTIKNKNISNVGVGE